MKMNALCLAGQVRRGRRRREGTRKKQQRQVVKQKRVRKEEVATGRHGARGDTWSLAVHNRRDLTGLFAHVLCCILVALYTGHFWHTSLVWH